MYATVLVSWLALSHDAVLLHPRHLTQEFARSAPGVMRLEFDATAPTEAYQGIKKTGALVEPDRLVWALPLPVPEPDGLNPVDLLALSDCIAPTTAVFQLCHDVFETSEAVRRLARRLAIRQNWVAVSDQNRAMLAETFNLDPKLVKVVPNGVEQVPAALSDEERSSLRSEIGFTGQMEIAIQVGRLVRWKNPESSLRALAQVEGLLLLFAGAGYDQPRLEEVARELRVSDRVMFLGQRGDVRKLLEICDYYLHPSIAEGASFALMEAMASGRRIIAARAASNGEILGGEDGGWLFAPDDVDDFANKIRAAREAKEESLQRARFAQLRVTRNYSQRKMLEEMESVIFAS